MDRMIDSEHPRKALIVFTDGNDNGSNLSYKDVVDNAQTSGVLLYFVAIGSRILVDTRTLESLSDISGGRTHYANKGDSISAILQDIRGELSKQYYLGYYASRKPGFHRIRVEVPNRNVKIRAKTGYRG
jgi:Ca-activated chloride channel family protein